MGLAVVHGIVKDHGGDIRVSSKLNQGTVFDIVLPLYRSDDTMDAERFDSDVPKGRETILLVDDEAAVVDISLRMLNNLGYRVLTFTDPVLAVAQFSDRNKEIDLVITDKTMPLLTGFDVAEKIRSVAKEIPIILCTGFDEKKDLERAQQLNITEVVAKPISLASLGTAVRKALDR